MNPQIPVPFPTRFQEGSGGGGTRSERSETTRATPGDGPNGATIQDRADSPGATTRFLRSKAPSPDMCPGETAATDAQWGDRAFERQYRDRMGLRWLVCGCVFRVHDQQAPAWRRSEGSASCTKNEDGSSVLTGYRRSMSCRSAMAKGRRWDSASSPMAALASAT